MAVTVEIANQQKTIPIHPSPITRLIKTTLDYLGVPQARLSIAFVTDRKIRTLNKKFLTRDRVTDVLAFDLTANVRVGRGKKRTLDGEIVISAVTARRQAKEYGTAPYRELVLYVVHGILHLVGFDDHRVRDRQRMRRKETEIMGVLFPQGDAG